MSEIHSGDARQWEELIAPIAHEFNPLEASREDADQLHARFVDTILEASLYAKPADAERYLALVATTGDEMLDAVTETAKIAREYTPGPEECIDYLGNQVHSYLHIQARSFSDLLSNEEDVLVAPRVANIKQQIADFSRGKIERGTRVVLATQAIRYILALHEDRPA